MYNPSAPGSVGPAVGGLAGGGTAVLAFTGAALTTYLVAGVLLLAAGALLRRLGRTAPNHS